MRRGLVARRHSGCRRLGSRGRKKLHKGAVKPLKSLARVNLCAGLPARLESAFRREKKRRLPRLAMSNDLPRHDDPCADPRALIEVDHVLVRHADAA
jgi:hypothetical protein